jgi:hypothetical protein
MILGDISWDTIAVAVVAGVLGPALLVYANARVVAASKKVDWARQDEVAAKAAAADAALVEIQQRIAKATEVNTASIAAIKKNGETAVHLADGAYTALLRTQRVAVAAKINSEQLLLAYREGTDRPPTETERQSILTSEAEIVKLDAEIAERVKAIAISKNYNPSDPTAPPLPPPAP